MSTDEPWRHWSSDADAEPDAADSDDDVLTSFLDRLAPAATPPAATPATPIPEPTSPYARVVRALPDAPEPERSPEVESLPAPSPPRQPQHDGSADASSEPAPVGRSEPPLPASPLEPPPQETPVSFTDWVEAQGGDPDGAPLKALGGFDNGVVAMGSGRGGGLRVPRLLVIGLLGAAVVVGGYLALEALEGRGGIIAPGIVEPPLEAPTAAAVALPLPSVRDDLADRLRRQVAATDRASFGTVEELEDVLFQALANHGTSPLRVQVDVLRPNDSREVYRRKPTRANLVIELGAIPGGGDEALDMLGERLITSWLVIGRVMSEDEVTFEQVGIRIPPPLRWNRRYPGARLAAFWQARLGAEELFAADP